MTAIIAVNTAA